MHTHMAIVLKGQDIVTEYAVADCALFDTKLAILLRPNNKSLSSSVEVWDLYSNTRLVTITGLNCNAYRYIWSHDGKLCAIMSYDGSVCIWNLSTGTQHCCFREFMAYSCDFSYTGPYIAIGSCDITIWDTNTNHFVRRLSGHTHVVTHCVYSPDNLMIASSSFDTCKLWNPYTGNCLYTVSLLAVRIITFSSRMDDPLVAIVRPATICLLSAHTGTQVSSIMCECIECAFSSDGLFLMVVTSRSIVRVWDVRLKAWACEYYTLDEGGHAPCFSPDRSMLSAHHTANNHICRIWQIPHQPQFRTNMLLMKLAAAKRWQMWLPDELWDCLQMEIKCN